MFPSFKQITFAQCCDIAEDVRSKYWDAKSIPVDIDHIIECGIKLTVIPMDGLRNDLDIYGFLSNDRSCIYVDSSVMIAPKFEAALRFTMAHELGHFFLHREFYESHRFTTAKEWKVLLGHIDGANLISYEDQADEFAGRLLIPRNGLLCELESISLFLSEVKKAVSSIYPDDQQQALKNIVADRLAPKFNVPFEVMVQRLKREAIHF